MADPVKGTLEIKSDPAAATRILLDPGKADITAGGNGTAGDLILKRSDNSEHVRLGQINESIVDINTTTPTIIAKGKLYANPQVSLWGFIKPIHVQSRMPTSARTNAAGSMPRMKSVRRMSLIGIEVCRVRRSQGLRRGGSDARIRSLALQAELGSSVLRRLARRGITGPILLLSHVDMREKLGEWAIPSCVNFTSFTPTGLGIA